MPLDGEAKGSELASTMWLTSLVVQSVVWHLVPMTQKAIIHDAEEGGFWAELPALTGCVTQGETIAEVHANLRKAMDLWLSVENPL